MSLLRELRKAVLGETWLLPLGVVGLLVGSAVVLEPALGGVWEDAGGAVLAGVLLVLLRVAVARSLRR